MRLLPFTVLIFLVVLMAMFVIPDAHAQAMTPPPGYSYGAKHFIAGSPDGALNDYQLYIDVYNTAGNSMGNVFYTQGNSAAFPDDIIVCNSNNDRTYPIWIEEGTRNATYARIWYNVDDGIPAAGTWVNIWYGNPNAASSSNIYATFTRLADDFDGATLNPAVWGSVNGNVTTGQGYLYLNATGSSFAQAYTTASAYANAPVNTAVCFRLNSDRSTKGFYGWTVPANGTGSTLYLNGGSSGTFQSRNYYMGTYTHDFGPGYSNTWNSWQIDRNGRSSNDFRVNGMLLWSQAGGVYGGPLAVLLRSEGANATVMVDWIFETNYTPNPPSQLQYYGFDADRTSGVAPLAVQFTDRSSQGISSWQWNFGDGTPNSTAQNPIHTYAAAGTYSVTLTVTDALGSTIMQKTGYISVTGSAPVADFTASPGSGTAPLTVQFTDTSANSPTSWQWNFGDGTANVTTQNPAHTYTTAGNYNVTLTATNAQGSASIQKAGFITVTLQAPVASFIANVTYGATPLTVQFTDTSGNNPTSWRWSFGDGSLDDFTQNPVHTYNNPGTRTVTLYATNGAGTSTATTVITITMLRYAASTINYYPTTMTANCQYNVSITMSNTGMLAWNSTNYALKGIFSASLFGPTDIRMADGTIVQSGQSYTFNFTVRAPAQSGSYYAVYQMACDGQTFGSTAFNRVNVILQAPVASFTANVTDGEAPLTVQLTDTTANGPTAWQWNFGDGTSNSTTQNPVHTYMAAGHYNITLTASNAQGSNSMQRIGYINVTQPKPVASFTANVTDGIAPLTVQFTDTSANSPTAWQWNFGDGTPNSTAQNPVHTYTAAGHYNVTLTVSNNVPGASSTQKISYINVTQQRPVASFTANVTYGASPLTIQFTDTSSNNPTSWRWSFGDGSLDDFTQNPVHTYNNPGTRTVTLYATNGAGTSTATTVITITMLRYASATVNYFPATMTANSQYNVSITMSNTGMLAWNSTNYTLKGIFNANQFGPTDIRMADGTIVQSGQSYTFNFTVRAPAQSGSYYAVYQMACDGQTFGSSAFNRVNVVLVKPVTSFTANVTDGVAPLTVQFTDTSANGPASWQWNFGDGTSNSTVQNPIHSYAAAGHYNVTLTASNGAGASSLMQAGLINVSGYAPTSPYFISDVTYGNAPLTVHFMDVSTGEAPDSREWNFGDGTGNVTTRSAAHTFDLPGIYTVILSLSNANGTYVWKQRIIANNPDVPALVTNDANITYPDGTRIILNGTAISNPNDAVQGRHLTFAQINATISEVKNIWNGNVVRIPVVWYSNAGSISGWDDGFSLSNGYPSGYSIDNLDQYLTACMRNGVYAILDFHNYDTNVYNPSDQSTTPVLRRFWSNVSMLYGNCSVTMFELFNEPGWPDGLTWDAWRENASGLAAIIRNNSPNIVIVSGLKMSYDARDAVNSPVTGTNIVYSTHTMVDSTYYSPDWSTVLGPVAEKYPVIMTEWGTYTGMAWNDTFTHEYLHPLVYFMVNHSYDGMLSWNWDPNMGGTPAVTSITPPFAYTSWGRYANNATRTMPPFSSPEASGAFTAGVPVQFNDIFGWSVTSWDWDFGDGTAHGTARNVTHIYSSPGTYTVRLNTSNAVYATGSMPYGLSELSADRTRLTVVIQ